MTVPLSERRANPDMEPQASRSSFVHLIESRQMSSNSLLCVGLDPVIDSIPDSFKKQVFTTGLSTDGANSKIIQWFSENIAGRLHPYVSAWKPNAAFFERYNTKGEGTEALHSLIRKLKEIDPTIPVILDAKRADIGNTNSGYADMLLKSGADAITVNPYFGIGSLSPFLEHAADKGLIILCRTSNPEAARMQDVIVKDRELGEVPYYIMVAHMAEEARQQNPNIAIVVGATNPDQLREARQIFNGQILVPGLGRQGGQPQDLIGAFDERGIGVIANNSSGIIHASKGEDFLDAAEEAALRWREEINKVRPQAA